AFDVAGSGRVLAGSDESGSTQLIELVDGASTRLTALSGAVTGPNPHHTGIRRPAFRKFNGNWTSNFH
ncbi:hypothetical protein OU415_32830, partial [Saccharopolyspora sp. WRP15-2]